MSNSRGPVETWVRRRLRRFDFARSAYAFTHAVRQARRDSDARARRGFEEWYGGGPDPWAYASRAEERERHAKALELIDRSLGQSLPVALEIGCSEGLFTSELAARCSSLLAVDISEVALSRAQKRCAAQAHVSFAKWNVRGDPPLGQFDLVVCMDVICDIHRPLAQRNAVRTVARSIAPGGNLVVSAVVQDPLIEEARWARWMGRGGRWVIDRFASQPNLSRVELHKTEWHLVALYQADVCG